MKHWIRINGNFVKFVAINFINLHSYKNSEGIENFSICYQVNECDIAYTERFTDKEKFDAGVKELESLLMGISND